MTHNLCSRKNMHSKLNRT